MGLRNPIMKRFPFFRFPCLLYDRRFCPDEYFGEGVVLMKLINGVDRHGRMARGGHGLPKVSPGPAQPDPYMPCGWPAYRAGGLRLSSTPLDTPRCTPMLINGVFLQHKNSISVAGEKVMMKGLRNWERRSDSIDKRRGVAEGVEEGLKAISGVARPQGVEG
jgi:hypothetical protein